MVAGNYEQDKMTLHSITSNNKQHFSHILENKNACGILPDKEIPEHLPDIATSLDCVSDDSEGGEIDHTPTILLIR